MKKIVLGLVAALMIAVTFAPQEASAQYYRRGGGGGGAVAAGIAAGILGGAVIGSVVAGQQRYYAPGPVYAAPGPYYYAQPGYVEGEEVVVVPRCAIRRTPLYDEYGNVVAFQKRRVCR